MKCVHPIRSKAHVCTHVYGNCLENWRHLLPLGVWPCVCPALILSFGCPVLLLHPHNPVHLQQTQWSKGSAFLCVARRTSLKGWPLLQNPICSITCISSALETVFSLVPSLPPPPPPPPSPLPSLPLSFIQL